MTNDTPDDLFGLVGTQLDDYDVERVVAAGGFGIVYFARHRALGQPVAIKVLKVPDALQGEGRAAFLRQFLGEAKTIAALKHPAIVGVVGYRVSPMPSGGDAPWMALEWVEGETLAAQLARRRGGGGREPRECLRLLEPVFDALAVAHARGIAHRDIKPANLMLPTGGASGRFGVLTRVLDFGIAKVTDAEDRPGSGQTETSSQFLAFSMPYASFEQVSGTRTGPWTDVHALALILVEMLTDQPPFGYGDRGELMMQVMSPTRPTPARFGVDVGPWEPVLARALALKPGERYPNAGEFLAALEAHVPATVGRGPVGARPSAVDAYANDPQRGGSTTAPVSTASLRAAVGPAPRRAPWTMVAAVCGAAVLGAAGFFGVRALTRPGAATAIPSASVPRAVVAAPLVAAMARDAAVALEADVAVVPASNVGAPPAVGAAASNGQGPAGARHVRRHRQGRDHVTLQ